MKKVLRLLTNYDQFLTHRFEVRDANHSTFLKVTRPAKVFKSKLLVTRVDDSPRDHPRERLRQDPPAGSRSTARRSAGIQAENWRAWNFSIKDHNDVEVAKITKTWGGFVKAAFTTADNYVVEIHRPLQGPLASMVVASALTIDTAPKQDSD